jgi:hypothetical protein
VVGEKEMSDQKTFDASSATMADLRKFVSTTNFPYVIIINNSKMQSKWWIWTSKELKDLLNMLSGIPPVVGLKASELKN